MLCVKGKRPEIPKESPSNIKKLIEECWKQDATKRIRSFQLIHHLIDQDLQPQPQLDSQTIERKIEENKLKDENEKQQEFEEILSSLTETEMQRSEEHTSELQSLMRNSYAVFCLNTKQT